MSTTKIKVILLGGNGQLGSDIVNAANHDYSQFEVRCLTHKELDLAHLNKITKVLSATHFNVLVNCASYHDVDVVEANTMTAMLINAYAVEAMAKVCEEKNARFIHISTDYVFGDPVATKPLVETDPPGPVNVYGASKLLGERLAMDVCEDTLILRVAALFGIAGSRTKPGNFVETILKSAEEKGKLQVVDDQTISPTATHDVAWMLFELLSKDAAAGIYHAVNTGVANWYEFAKEIIRQAKLKNVKLKAVKNQDRKLAAPRPTYSALNNTKLKNTIGHAVPTWQQALEVYLKNRQV
ncbi:MAG: dTDP-4-dehydrorhamnose reductase [Gammaproteobacteria bacterium]|nr:dTDP-4-dehydrorhamnose reductase [Gammaproteobacteria bacterium]